MSLTRAEVVYLSNAVLDHSQRLVRAIHGHPAQYQRLRFRPHRNSRRQLAGGNVKVQADSTTKTHKQQTGRDENEQDTTLKVQRISNL